MEDPNSSAHLYAEYIKPYPRDVAGFFRTLKWAASGILLGIFWLLPYVRWDRGPDAPSQAVLIDMPGSRAYFFAIEIWPQEVYYLTGLLIIAAIGLFLATAMLGRIWCGFACFQTVWTDLFIKIESLIEGDRNARIKLDQGPMNGEKLLKKTVKHGLFLLVALMTGIGFVMFFADAFLLWHEIPRGEAGVAIYSTIAFGTATTYIMAGLARDQVCIYMCPYARFQGAMLDDESLIITYEAWRGEPRGKAKKKAGEDKKGDCVDCAMCFQACPTGTDIRKGAQLECIGCGLCIDACNSVMAKVGLPKNLITYDSVTNQNARTAGLPTKFRLLRPRTLGYIGIIFLVVAIMGLGLGNRSTLDASVQHERSPVFVRLSDGGVRNAYTFKILNKMREERSFSLTIQGLEEVKISVVGQEKAGNDAMLSAGPDSVAEYRVFLTQPQERLKSGDSKIAFTVTDLKSKMRKSVDDYFKAP
jgi:cytochrome c oxidase accessory protein FixG